MQFKVYICIQVLFSSKGQGKGEAQLAGRSTHCSLPYLRGLERVTHPIFLSLAFLVPVHRIFSC